MKNLIFSEHAAKRWFERARGLDFNYEVSNLEKIKKRVFFHREHNASVYRTPGGVFLVIKRNLVLTVLPRNWLERVIKKYGSGRR